MKKITFLFLVALTMKLTSQNSIALAYDKSFLPIAHNSTIDVVTTAMLKKTVTIDIENVGTIEKSYDVKRYDMVLNKIGTSKAQAFFCFAGQCYDTATFVSGDELVLQPNTSASDVGQAYFTLDADLIEATSTGLSIVKYTFFDIANTSDSAQITFRYNYQPVGVKENAKNISSFSIFPNPSKGSVVLNVTSGVANTAALQVYNSIGSLVIERQIPMLAGENKIAADLNELSAGVYMVQLKQGATVVTRKLIVE